VVYVFIHQFSMFPLISGTAGNRHAWLYFLMPILVLGTQAARSPDDHHLRGCRGCSRDIRTARAKARGVAPRSRVSCPGDRDRERQDPFLLGG
jgi:hypothetical protein